MVHTDYRPKRWLYRTLGYRTRESYARERLGIEADAVDGSHMVALSHPAALANRLEAYRREVIETIQPLLSKHFNLTVEMPLKAVVRGHSFAVIPTDWTNRTSGVAKLAMKEMGSRYLFIVLYVWLESTLSRGDYKASA